MRVRPRIASVVSVVWLYVGAWWVSSGVFGLSLWLDWQSFLRRHPAESAADHVLLWPPLLMLVVGASGFLCGLGLLRNWERFWRLMRLVNIGAIACVLVFTWAFVSTVTQTASEWRAPSTEQVQMAVAGVIAGLVFVSPFLIMARKLSRLGVALQIAAS